MYRILKQVHGWPVHIRCQQKLYLTFSKESCIADLSRSYESRKCLSHLIKLDDHISTLKEKLKSQGLIRLIESFENYGHRVADINPIYSLKNVLQAQLLPETYGLIDTEEVQLACMILIILLCTSISIGNSMVYNMESSELSSQKMIRRIELCCSALFLCIIVLRQWL